MLVIVHRSSPCTMWSKKLCSATWRELTSERGTQGPRLTWTWEMKVEEEGGCAGSAGPGHIISISVSSQLWWWPLVSPLGQGSPWQPAWSPAPASWAEETASTAAPGWTRWERVREPGTRACRPRHGSTRTRQLVLEGVLFNRSPQTEPQKLNQSINFHLYSSKSLSKTSHYALKQSQENQLNPPDQKGETLARKKISQSKKSRAVPDLRERSFTLTDCGEKEMQDAGTNPKVFLASS